MDWYFRQLKKTPLELKSPLIDCETCEVRLPLKASEKYHKSTKCCQFSPFVSAFAVGALIRDGIQWEEILSDAGSELVLTKLGVIHSHEHRKRPKALCHFFQKSSGRCSIWAHRPPTCFSFFCASPNFNELSQLEQDLLDNETRWLKQWYFSTGGNEKDWTQWGLAMEAEPLVPIPESFVFENWEAAENLYLQSLFWLEECVSSISL